MDWLLQLESVYHYNQFRYPKKVLLIETKLRKGAMHWWRNLQSSREKASQPRIDTWAEMKREFEQRYIQVSYQQYLSECIASFT